MNAASFVTQKINWKAIAREVSKMAGKPYEPGYIRDVANGYRINHQVKPILEKLGVSNLKAA